MKSAVIFAVAAALALVAANHRFGDSAHAIGMISAKGGRAMHPFALGPDQENYTLIATATVQPPYRGDVRVVVEGLPDSAYALYPVEPAVRLGWHHQPEFRSGVWSDLRPGDRLALWVRLQPETAQKKAGPELALAFYDEKSEAQVLRMPIVIGEEGGHGRH